MRWRIIDFIFCERQQTLVSTKDNQHQTQQLEPIVVELLAYFCKNPDVIISRSQLINDVWSGRMITDNAVNKVITKLRKSFNDDAKKPKFIATFPKKGYKFIAAATQIYGQQESDEIQLYSESLSLHANKKTGYYLILLVLVVLITGFVITWQVNKIHPPITQVKALTRDPGAESRPQISPNGQYLAYIEVRNKKMHQWIKSLKDESKIEINHGKEQTTWVDSVSWNHDGSMIVYLVTTPTSCQYYRRTFNNMSIGEPQLLHNCPANSYGKIAYTHDENRLVYAESNGVNTPFSLFEMNLETGVKLRLNQPELFLGGNSQFDLHPNENKILISSPDEQQWEGFYSLDLDTNELELLFKQDAYVCCGIWDHSGQRVVLLGEHPAYELVSYNLQGEDRRVIYAGSEQVRVPERHVNGKDYMFSVTHANQDIHYLEFISDKKKTLVDTSVDDRLASFAHHTSQVAYIGLSSGNEEIWLTDINGKGRKKLTSFEDSRHYIDLMWSYNGESIIGVTLNEIHLINTTTGEFQVLKLPQVEMRGVSWKNDNTVSFIIKNNKHWQVNYYDIKTHQATSENENWQFIRYSKNQNDILLQDNMGDLFSGKDRTKVLEKELQEVDFMVGRLFNLKKTGSKWAWLSREDGKNKLYLKTNLNQSSLQMADTDSYHFDLNDKGLLYHTSNSFNSDIYQTLSQYRPLDYQ